MNDARIGKYVLRGKILFQVVGKHPNDRDYILENVRTETVIWVSEEELSKLRVVVPNAA